MEEKKKNDHAKKRCADGLAAMSRAQQAFTVFGAYMPVRSRAERFVLPTWERLMDAVERTEQGRVLIGGGQRGTIG